MKIVKLIRVFEIDFDEVASWLIRFLLEPIDALPFFFVIHAKLPVGSGAPIDLEGVTVVHARPDGSSDDTLVLDTVTIAAGGYLVLGPVHGTMGLQDADVWFEGCLGESAGNAVASATW